MPKHNVQIYCITKITVSDVEAATPNEAAKIAKGMTDFHQMQGEYVEIESFLIDTLDEESILLDANGKSILETELDADFSLVASAAPPLD